MLAGTSARWLLLCLVALIVSACGPGPQIVPTLPPPPTATPVVRRWNVPAPPDKDATIKVGLASSAVVTIEQIIRTNDPALTKTPLAAGEELLIAAVRYRYAGWGEQEIKPQRDFYLEQELKKVTPTDPATLSVSNLLEGKLKDKETKTGNVVFRVSRSDAFHTFVYQYEKSSLRVDINDAESRQVTAVASPTAQTLQPAPTSTTLSQPTRTTPASTPVPPTAVPATLVPTPSRAALTTELDATWARQDWPAAIRAAEALIALEPGNPEHQEKLAAARISYGDQLVRSGQNEAAAQAYRAAANGKPHPLADAKMQALTPVPSPPTPTAVPTMAPAALLDVSTWMGKSPQEFAARYGAPYVTDTIRPSSNSESMPRGGIQHGYKTAWGLLDVGFTDGRAVRIELTIGDTRPEIPKSWEAALRSVGLPGDARPAQSGPAARRYPNANGFVVQLNGSATSVGDIIVWRVR
jgi:hypothetical protein